MDICRPILFCFGWEGRSYYVAQDSLDIILLPVPSLDYKHIALIPGLQPHILTTFPVASAPSVSEETTTLHLSNAYTPVCCGGVVLLSGSEH